ncbi:MAG: hypothetical protein LBB34_00110, partial [Holosporales bacterium]|nr:hypothetical protein [Holosporales bacterium]
MCNERLDYGLWAELYQNVLLKFRDEFYEGESITSVYFGGGTPSLLPVSFVHDFLDTVYKNFRLDN